MAAPFDDSTMQTSASSSPRTGEGVIVDIGTGDGLFVYHSAQQNPNRFFIGIDANPRPLEKISEKIHRKPHKGGLPNVLFVQGAVEDLPSELDGVADEVHIHFPWGSLLRGVAAADPATLQNLRRICAPGALLEIVIGVDSERDSSELDRLGLKPLSLPYIDSVLAPGYRAAGFELMERGQLTGSDSGCVHTSWAKRLRSSDTRAVFYVVARAGR